MLPRIPEPELMDDPRQAAAYAAADFSEPHGMFIDRFQAAFLKDAIRGYVLDLGCGPADISMRFARRYPACRVDGVDGAACMLVEARRAIDSAGLSGRIRLVRGTLPGARLPRRRYSTIISNSLLHHLHDPGVLWESIKRYAAHRARVFVMDLRRPATEAAARKLVKRYAGEEPLILQRDFYNSLRAAFLPEEVGVQLREAGLGKLRIETVSDRHYTVFGRL